MGRRRKISITASHPQSRKNWSANLACILCPVCLVFSLHLSTYSFIYLLNNTFTEYLSHAKHPISVSPFLLLLPHHLFHITHIILSHHLYLYHYLYLYLYHLFFPYLSPTTYISLHISLYICINFLIHSFIHSTNVQQAPSVCQAPYLPTLFSLPPPLSISFCLPSPSFPTFSLLTLSMAHLFPSPHFLLSALTPAPFLSVGGE